ncbi:MAG: hypothetical protein GC191_18070 [Azospirillum sp.]|nr:hypothetical protein [Azospirillum sp.]
MPDQLVPDQLVPDQLVPDQLVIAKASRCAHRQAGLTEADQTLHGRYDKIGLLPVRPVVTQEERCVGHLPVPWRDHPGAGAPGHGGQFAVRPVDSGGGARSALRPCGQLSPADLVDGAPVPLAISEGALDAMFQRAKPKFEHEVMAILSRFRRCRIVCSDEPTVRVQDLMIEVRVIEVRVIEVRLIRYWRACDQTPEGKLMVVSLPAQLQGRFGANLRRFLLSQHYQCRVTMPRNS